MAPMKLLMDELGLVVPKIFRFKTAYSFAYKSFVQIEKVIENNGEYTFVCRVPTKKNKVVFKKNELTDFCL